MQKGKQAKISKSEKKQIHEAIFRVLDFTDIAYGDIKLSKAMGNIMIDLRKDKSYTDQYFNNANYVP